MSFIILYFLALSTVFWGIKSQEEIFQLSGVVVGTILFIWALCLTPQTFLFAGEVIAIIAIFRICVRCCECDG